MIVPGAHRGFRALVDAVELVELGEVFAVSVAVVAVVAAHIVQINDLVITELFIVALGRGLASGLAARALGLVARVGLLGATALFGGRGLGGGLLNGRSRSGGFVAHHLHIAAHLDGARLGAPRNGLKIGEDHVIDNFFEFFRHTQFENSAQSGKESLSDAFPLGNTNRPRPNGIGSARQKPRHFHWTNVGG